MDLVERLGNAIWSRTPRVRRCYSCQADDASVTKSAGGPAVFCSEACRDSWEQTMREW